MKGIIPPEGDSPILTLKIRGQSLGVKSSAQLAVSVDLSSTTKRT